MILTSKRSFAEPCGFKKKVCSSVKDFGITGYIWEFSSMKKNFDIHRVTYWKSLSLSNQLISFWYISHSVLGVLRACLELTSHNNLKFELHTSFSRIWICIFKKNYFDKELACSPFAAILLLIRALVKLSS